MAIFNEKLGNIVENAKYLASNKIDNYSFKNELSIDDVKKSISLKCLNSEIAKKMGGNYPDFHNLCYIIQTLKDETNPFYSTNSRTGILNILINSLEAKVTNDLTFEIGNNKVLIEDVEEQFLGEYSINEEVINELINNLILFNHSYAKVNVNYSNLNLKIIKPQDVIIFENGYGHVYVRNGKIEIEKRFMNNENVAIIQIYQYDEFYKSLKLVYQDYLFSNDLAFYSIKSDINTCNYALCENILQYSELESLLQKEVKLGETNLFVDRQYLGIIKKLRSHFVPVKTPDTTSVETSNKPLFEFIQPTLRSNEIKVLKEMKKEDIANVYGIDKTALGLESSINTTATEINSNNSQTVEKINKIRRKIESSINSYLEILTGNKQNKVDLSTYYISNFSTTVKDNQLALTSNSMTIKTAVERLHPDWNADEINIEYLTIMYQKGINMTPEEEKLAIEYGIMVDVPIEGINGSVL